MKNDYTILAQRLLASLTSAQEREEIKECMTVFTSEMLEGIGYPDYIREDILRRYYRFSGDTTRLDHEGAFFDAFYNEYYNQALPTLSSACKALDKIGVHGLIVTPDEVYISKIINRQPDEEIEFIQPIANLMQGEPTLRGPVLRIISQLRDMAEREARDDVPYITLGLNTKSGEVGAVFSDRLIGVNTPFPVRCNESRLLLNLYRAAQNMPDLRTVSLFQVVPYEHAYEDIDCEEKATISLMDRYGNAIESNELMDKVVFEFGSKASLQMNPVKDVLSVLHTESAITFDLATGHVSIDHIEKIEGLRHKENNFALSAKKDKALIELIERITSVSGSKIKYLDVSYGTFDVINEVQSIKGIESNGRSHLLSSNEPFSAECNAWTQLLLNQLLDRCESGVIDLGELTIDVESMSALIRQSWYSTELKKQNTEFHLQAQELFNPRLDGSFEAFYESNMQKQSDRSTVISRQSM